MPFDITTSDRIYYVHETYSESGNRWALKAHFNMTTGDAAYEVICTFAKNELAEFEESEVFDSFTAAIVAFEHRLEKQ